MTFRRAAVLSGIIAASAIVIGLLLRPESDQQSWAAVAFLVCCGCFVLFGSLDALKTNCVQGQFWTASRERNPFAHRCLLLSGHGSRGVRDDAHPFCGRARSHRAIRFRRFACPAPRTNN